MHHTGTQPGQPAQRVGCVQITLQRRDATGAQLIGAVPVGGERHQAHPPRQGLRHTQTDITATDDQNTLAAKAGRQGAWACGVQIGARGGSGALI